MKKEKKVTGFVRSDIKPWDGVTPLAIKHKRLLTLEPATAKQLGDVVFNVGVTESRPMYAHASIIAARWPAMMEIIQSKKAQEKKKDPKPVQIEVKYSAEVWDCVLRHVYGENISIGKLSARDIVAISVAATAYKLDRLRLMLEHHIASILSMETVFEILKAAHELGQPTVKALVLDFATQHYAEFLSNKDGVRTLGLDLFQEAVADLTAMQAAPKKPLKLAEVPPQRLVADMKDLYDTMKNADAVCLCHGDKIRFHRAILASQSTVWLQWVLTHEKGLADASAAEIKGISVDGFNALLRFAYYGDTKIDSKIAAELLNGFAERVQMADFISVCEYNVQAVTSESAIQTLALCYAPDMADREEMKRLKESTIRHISTHLPDINLQPLIRLDPTISVDILVDYQTRVRANKGQPLYTAPQQQPQSESPRRGIAKRMSTSENSSSESTTLQSPNGSTFSPLSPRAETVSSPTAKSETRPGSHVGPVSPRAFTPGFRNSRPQSERPPTGTLQIGTRNPRPLSESPAKV